MRRLLEEIQERIVEIDRVGAEEDQAERRVFDVTTGFYAEQAKAEVAGLAALLSKAGIDRTDLDAYFRIQEGEAKRRIEVVTPLLQPTEAELAQRARIKQAVLAIDPCNLVPHRSPGWKCSFLASSCGTWVNQGPNSSASATCTPAYCNNVIDISCQAIGQGPNSAAVAQAKAWFVFSIPARPAATNVWVDVWSRLDGFYITRKAGTGTACVRMDMKAELFQYGYSWASKAEVPLYVGGDTMSRLDTNSHLQFMAPVGADPFEVKVTVQTLALVKSGGSLALIDFATGAGNAVDVVWCNTLSND